MCIFTHQGCENVDTFLGVIATGCPKSTFHFFFMAFSAALVLLPSTALGVVALMTPTATVCLMSRTANLEETELVREVKNKIEQQILQHNATATN